MKEFDAEKHNHTIDETAEAPEVMKEEAPLSQENFIEASQAEAVSKESESDRQEQGYTFIRNGCPEGRVYTTPEGAHGFVYAPPHVPSGNGVGRKLIIATCVLGCILLFMGCCFFGAWAAARTSHEFRGENYSRPLDDNRENSGTAGDFVIVDGTEAISPKETSAENPAHRDPVPNEKETLESTGAQLPEEIPEEVNIPKKKPQRMDQDGDGKPDAAFDSKGQLITSAGDAQLTRPTIINRVAASVVEISTETLVQSNPWVGQYITSGAGSGVIISAEGFIITNHHVVDGADSIVVRLNDGTEFPATMVGSDEQTDVAILWINPDGYPLTVAALGCSYDLVAGEDIIAIGNPLGSLGGTVTEGIISATERQITIDGNDMTLLQVSAPINPGNSGGGLFNMAGELVGVVNAKMSSEEIEGLGFAIPVDTAYAVACELIEHRYVRGRVTTGLTLLNVESVQTAIYYFNSRYTGVYVYESVSDVLVYGDLVLTVNGQKIETVEDVSKAIEGLGVGDTVEFVVYRNQQETTVQLTLMEYIPDYLLEDENSVMPAA